MRGVGRQLHEPVELADHLTLPTKFRNDNTRTALAGTGVFIPGFAEYADRLSGS